MKPYGAQREHQPMDRKRRYLSSAMRPGDLREERADKRKARAAGEAEIRKAVAVMAAAGEDVSEGEQK